MPSTPMTAYLATLMGVGPKVPEFKSAESDLEWARSALAELSLAIKGARPMNWDQEQGGLDASSPLKIKALHEWIKSAGFELAIKMASARMRPMRDGSGRWLLKKEGGLFCGKKMVIAEHGKDGLVDFFKASIIKKKADRPLGERWGSGRHWF